METLRIRVAQEHVRDLQREAAAWRRVHEGRRWAGADKAPRSSRRYSREA
jgi:hypothetical protein